MSLPLISQFGNYIRQHEQNPETMLGRKSSFPVCLLMRRVPGPMDILLLSTYITYMIQFVFLYLE